MVYESFFKSELSQLKAGLLTENRFYSLFVRIGANALNQAGANPYDKHHNMPINLDMGSIRDNMQKENLKKLPPQGWLVWHLHDCLLEQVGEMQFESYIHQLAGLAWKEIQNASHICYVLPFLAYYESRWNARKGYGELAALAKELANGSYFHKPVFNTPETTLGSLMAAMAQCYGEMTEEAYDQREIFADLLRNYAEDFKNQWKHRKEFGCRDRLLAAYAWMKGIRLGVLHHEEYGDTAKEVLTAVEAEGFICKDGRICLKEEAGEEPHEIAMYCMMAYGEYVKLKKERPYYGI